MYQVVECGLVPVDSSAVDRVNACWCQHRIAAPWLPGLHIGYVDFDGGEFGGDDGIVDGVAVVGEGTGVDDETVVGVPGIVEAVDDGALMVGLVARNLDVSASPPLSQGCF